MSERYSGRFPTTAWSVLDAARDDNNAMRHEDMNRFISGYWKPVFYFLRAKGMRTDQAEELTQEFFLQLLVRGSLDRADRQRGRFRNFLLKVLQRFVYDWAKRPSPQSRLERSMVVVSALVKEEDRAFEPADGETPEQVFMRTWAQSVIANVCRRLKKWCEEQGRPDWYEYFQIVNVSVEKRVTQEELAEMFRTSRDQVRYGLQQTKEQFIKDLRDELRDQVDSDEQLDSEVRGIQSLL